VNIMNVVPWSGREEDRCALGTTGGNGEQFM
jgi:hypothetical protein